jgi:hypothetical protein
VNKLAAISSPALPALAAMAGGARAGTRVDLLPPIFRR